MTETRYWEAASFHEKGQIMNRQEEELWLGLGKKIQELERKSGELSPEELMEAVSDLKSEGEELRDRMEESLEKMTESVRFSAKGEALEEESAVLEDTLDLLDELLSLLEDSGEAGAEDAAAILSEAADYMGDVLQ